MKYLEIILLMLMKNNKEVLEYYAGMILINKYSMIHMQNSVKNIKREQKKPLNYQKIFNHKIKNNVNNFYKKN